MNKVKGTFWVDRFKSVLFEKGDSLDAVLAYIELNPIRAKMVKLTEEYRFSSIAYRSSNKKEKKEFLSYEGLSFEDKRDVFSRYKKLVYEFGDIVIKKKNRHVYKTGVSDKILSVRKLIE